MKYLKQFAIILGISFLGEVLHHLLPFPIPASIYGIVTLFVLLSTKVLKVSQVKETSAFLIEIMPAMFIPAAVGLINVWDLLREKLVLYLLIIVVSTLSVMTVSAYVCQFMMNKGGKGNE